MRRNNGSNETALEGAPAEQAWRGRGEALPVRNRYYERFGEQGLGLPTYRGLRTEHGPESSGGTTGWYDPQPRPRQGEAADGARTRGRKPQLRPDERLRELVCERFGDHEGIDASDTEAKVRGAVRQARIASLDEIEAVVLESSGEFSVVLRAGATRVGARRRRRRARTARNGPGGGWRPRKTPCSRRGCRASPATRPSSALSLTSTRALSSSKRGA